jgi:hypothetical protein
MRKTPTKAERHLPPSKSKSTKFPDHSKIFGTIKVTGPKSALTWKQGSWHLVFYNIKNKSQMMNLYTDDLEEAGKKRDAYYAAAKRCGRGGHSKLERYAERVLREKGYRHNWHYVVNFGGTASFRTEAEAMAWQKMRARAILKRDGEEKV